MTTRVGHDDSDSLFCRLYVGECREVLARLPERSIQCVVTSPPYYGLRTYAGVADSLWADGWSGVLGNEPSVAQYVGHMVEVFRAVRPVLRDDGTVWLNLGDSYSNEGKWGGKSGEKNYTSAAGGIDRRKRSSGMKPKDRCIIPARVAIALCDDGWFLRSEIVWAKPNGMPSSVQDRPGDAHEMIYLLTKKPKYFYDSVAVRTPARPSSVARLSQDIAGQAGSSRAHGGSNLRSVWTIATHPFKEAHFATFPPQIPQTAIKAGTSERGCCAECGSPWKRTTLNRI